MEFGNFEMYLGKEHYLGEEARRTRQIHVCVFREIRKVF